MDNLKWCFNQAKGIKFVESNLNVAKAYLDDAKKDMSLVNKKEPKWNIIKEYYLFGRNNNFDELLNKKFNEEDFDYESYNFFRNEGNFSKTLEKDVLLNNLRIKEGNYFKNAGVLLFSKDITKFFTSSKVVCALFQGENKTKILDKKEFTGSIIKNYEEIINYLKEKLNTEFVINDAGPRKEFLEFPEDALKEAVINALVHKDYTSNAHVQINIFKNRVEIVNPAVLPNLPFEDILKGSFPRNPFLHSLLNRIDLVENVGSGISRINEYMQEYRLGNPKYEFNGLWFIVVFSRPDMQNNSYEKRVLNEPVSEPVSEPVNDKERIVLNYIKLNPGCNRTKIVNELNYSLGAVKRYIGKLINLKFIEYKGSDKNGGYWKVNEK